MKNSKNGQFFPEALTTEIREKFYYVDADPEHGKRLFFENSGGSLRLKKASEAWMEYQAFPDCPERIHERSLQLKEVQKQGTRDIVEVIFGAKSGSLLVEMTASQVMFQMVGTIMENCPGTNAVTSSLEHPSAFDAVKYYCEKTGKEFRVLEANPLTGGIEPEEVQRKVDQNTCLLSVMSASNITGTIMDLKAIIAAAKENSPDIYIITDAVQHAPHGVIDVEDLGVDGVNFAPYKFFGPRGMAYGYVSDRVAALPHRRLLQKEIGIWELGSPAPGAFAAMTEVVNYVCWIGRHYTDNNNRRAQFITGMEQIHLHERALLDRMLNGSEKAEGLRHIPGVHVYIDVEDITNRDLILAIGIDGIGFTECVHEYQRRGVTVYERVNTSVYSKRIVEAVGLEGAIRVSPLHCHTAEDIDAFLRITKELAQDYAK